MLSRLVPLTIFQIRWWQVHFNEEKVQCSQGLGVYSVSTQWVLLTQFLSDPGKPGVPSLGPDVSERRLCRLTDVTLADEDTNSILTDIVNRAIQGNVAIQVTYYVTRLNLVVAKFATNASGAIWWQNLQLIQVEFFQRDLVVFLFLDTFEQAHWCIHVEFNGK